MGRVERFQSPSVAFSRLQSPLFGFSSLPNSAGGRELRRRWVTPEMRVGEDYSMKKWLMVNGLRLHEENSTYEIASIDRAFDYNIFYMNYLYRTSAACPSTAMSSFSGRPLRTLCELHGLRKGHGRGASRSSKLGGGAAAPPYLRAAGFRRTQVELFLRAKEGGRLACYSKINLPQRFKGAQAAKLMAISSLRFWRVNG